MVVWGLTPFDVMSSDSRIALDATRKILSFFIFFSANKRKSLVATSPHFYIARSAFRFFLIADN